jgi:II/X family phage/plasmid replication protein
MYDLKRVDATGMLALPSQQDVVRFIHAATPVVRGRHQGVSAYGGETIYLGQKSRRITTKLYNKFLELKKHPLPTDIPSHDDLMRYAENRLRVEVCIRSQELKDRGLSTAANWNSETASTLVAERLKNMNLPEKMKLPDKTLKALPGSLAGAYALWMDGHDLREIYPKRTFYRYRSGLLAHGIDITASRPKSSTADVIPMVRYLFADFRGTAEVPQFARGTTLYADPSTFRRRAA